MYVGSARDVKQEDLNIPGVHGVKIRWLIGKPEGAQDFATRLVTLAKGGEIPLHAHPATHQQFFLKGKGVVLSEGGEHEVGPGDFVFVAANEKHGLRNTGQEDLEVICCINLPPSS